MQRIAIGVIRVSELGDRDPDSDSFLSPNQQRSRMQGLCDQLGITLTETEPEYNVSGGTPLAKRKGIRWGVEQIEQGKAHVLTVAYFDRLVRDLVIQNEIVDRVEAAGGEVLTVDFGKISNKTSAEWLKGTMAGTYAEYFRRQVRERTNESKADAVARGIPPFAQIPPGYFREVVGYHKSGRPRKGPLVPDPDKRGYVLEGWEMKDRGDSYQKVRKHLAAHGMPRSHRAVTQMFKNRIYLGELSYGEWVNPNAHEGIIPPSLFASVLAKMEGPRSTPQGRSDRLLARLGVLRCFEGSRMVVSKQTRTLKSGEKREYAYYKCSSQGDCKRRLTISAPLAEGVVVDGVKEALDDLEGRASVEANSRAAEAALERAQESLDSAIRVFAGLEDEEAARQRLDELRRQRDEALALVDQLSGSGATIALAASKDWDRLELDERRDLIRATVREAVVSPDGDGADRLALEFFLEDASSGSLEDALSVTTRSLA